MKAPLELLKTHNPPFSYFSTVSMTLLSIVQGIALTGIIEVASNRLATGYSWRVFEDLVAICFTAALWHRYVIHHQFVGWQLTWIDTVIIVTFGIIEGLMVGALRDPNGVGKVHFFIFLGYFGGIFAYSYSIARVRNTYVKRVFRQHYRSQGEQIYLALLGHEYQSRWIVLIFAFILAILASACLWRPDLSGVVSPVSSLLIITYLIRWDLERYLTNDKKWEEMCEIGRCAYAKSKAVRLTGNRLHRILKYMAIEVSMLCPKMIKKKPPPETQQPSSLAPEDKPCLLEIEAVLKKHNAASKFGVVLLKSCFPMND